MRLQVRYRTDLAAVDLDHVVDLVLAEAVLAEPVPVQQRASANGRPVEPTPELPAGDRAGGHGCTPRVTFVSSGRPSRMYSTVTVSPGFLVSVTAARSSVVVAGFPSIAVMTSPSLRPAWAAGEPGTTDAT